MFHVKRGMRSLSEGFTLRLRRRRTNERTNERTRTNSVYGFCTPFAHPLRLRGAAATTAVGAAVMCATVAVATAAVAADAVLERVVPSTEMASQHES